MSALGQKQTSRSVRPMSALPPKADIVQHDRDVRFVPQADINRSFDHLDRADDKRLWHREAERL
jgi:hypothetical protein